LPKTERRNAYTTRPLPSRAEAQALAKAIIPATSAVPILRHRINLFEAPKANLPYFGKTFILSSTAGNFTRIPFFYTYVQ
jgi:hypothetical protein